jgi:hypothetical protein
LRDKLTDLPPSSIPKNWVVADPVGCEPVSAAKFPAIRENYREKGDFRRLNAICIAKSGSAAAIFYEIP